MLFRNRHHSKGLPQVMCKSAIRRSSEKVCSQNKLCCREPRLSLVDFGPLSLLSFFEKYIHDIILTLN